MTGISRIIQAETCTVYIFAINDYRKIILKSIKIKDFKKWFKRYAGKIISVHVHTTISIAENSL